MRAQIHAALLAAVVAAAGCSDYGLPSDRLTSPAAGAGASQLSNYSVKLGVGKVVLLASLLSDGRQSPARNPVSWHTSDTTVVVVNDSGVVKAVSPGTATVTATVADSTTATVKVSVAPIAADTASVATVQPGAPELPRVSVDVTMPTVTGHSVPVHSGGDFQAALNAAQPGDEIVLQAGATFVGPFVLPAKSGAGWIIIRSSGALPSAGVRVQPSDAAQMPKLVSQNSSIPVIQTAPGAHNYRLTGLEITANDGATDATSLVNLGDGSTAQNSLDKVPHDLVLDRMFIHGTSSLGFRRCIALNSGSTAIIDSYISECHSKDFDTQAIAGWNGPGPYRIEDNFLEGSAENVSFGGADPAIQGLIPSDIVFRHNYFFKPMSWRGVWEAKNLLEIKSAQRVLLEGNVFENSWADAQTGFAIVFWSVNQSGTCNWCTTQDITFRYNEIKNAAGGFQLTDRYDKNSIPMARVLIEQNVATGVGNPSLGDNGRMFQVLGAIADLQLVHNTALSTEHGILLGSSPAVLLPRFIVKDNIIGGGSYQLFSPYGSGASAWQLYAGAGSVFLGNVIVGGTDITMPAGNSTVASAAAVGFTQYPTDAHLRTDSPFYHKGSDGTNPGADVTSVNQATAGVTP